MKRTLKGKKLYKFPLKKELYFLDEHGHGFEYIPNEVIREKIFMIEGLYPLLKEIEWYFSVDEEISFIEFFNEDSPEEINKYLKGFVYKKLKINTNSSKEIFLERGNDKYVGSWYGGLKKDKSLHSFSRPKEKVDISSSVESELKRTLSRNEYQYLFDVQIKHILINKNWHLRNIDFSWDKKVKEKDELEEFLEKAKMKENILFEIKNDMFLTDRLVINFKDIKSFEYKDDESVFVVEGSSYKIKMNIEQFKEIREKYLSYNVF